MKKTKIKFLENPTGKFNLSFSKDEVVEIESKQAEELIDAGYAKKTDESLTEYKERKKIARSPVFDKIKSDILEEIKQEIKAEIIEEVKEEIQDEFKKLQKSLDKKEEKNKSAEEEKGSK